MAGDISSSEENAPIAAINVTPFVDVVLVLLVIFMITAPALMKDVLGIQLPKASSADHKAPQSLGIAINRQGQMLVNGVLSDEAGVREQVKQAVLHDPNTQAIISADEEARHGDVVKAIDIIKSSGLNRFAIEIRHP